MRNLTLERVTWETIQASKWGGGVAGTPGLWMHFSKSLESCEQRLCEASRQAMAIKNLWDSWEVRTARIAPRLKKFQNIIPETMAEWKC